MVERDLGKGEIITGNGVGEKQEVDLNKRYRVLG